MKERREEERGRSKEGEIIDSASSSDRSHLVEEGASAVGEAGRDDPIEGPDVEEAVAEHTTAGGKKKVMGAEGKSPPRPLPQPEREDD